jgi:hypothetical protein
MKVCGKPLEYPVSPRGFLTPASKIKPAPSALTIWVTVKNSSRGHGAEAKGENFEAETHSQSHREADAPNETKCDFERST